MSRMCSNTRTHRYFVDWNTIRKNGRICKPKSKRATMRCIQHHNSMRLSPMKYIFMIRSVNDIWNPFVRDTLRLQHDYESQGLLGVFLTSSIKLTDFERSLDWHNNSYCIIFYEMIHTINELRLICPKGVNCVCMTFDVVRETLQGLIDSDVTSSMLL